MAAAVAMRIVCTGIVTKYMRRSTRSVFWIHSTTRFHPPKHSNARATAEVVPCPRRHDRWLAHRKNLDSVEVPMKNKLKVLRAERNWSQSKLADLAGVSRQTIHAVEAGKYDPSLPLAFKFSNIFELKIEEIFEPNRE